MSSPVSESRPTPVSVDDQQHVNNGTATPAQRNASFPEGSSAADDRYEKKMPAEICAKILGTLSEMGPTQARVAANAAHRTVASSPLVAAVLQKNSPTLYKAINGKGVIPELHPATVLLPDSRDAVCAEDRQRIWDVCIRCPSEAYNNLPEEAKTRLKDAFVANATTLDLSSRRIREVPREIEFLPQLKELDLIFCYDLTTLPKQIGKLIKLETLFLASCHNLTALPEQIGELSELKSLNLFGCHNLTALPEQIGELRNLERIDLFGCHNLTALPEQLGELRNLKRIDLFECHNLNEESRRLARGLRDKGVWVTEP